MRFRLEHSQRPPYWLVGDPALNERVEGSQALTGEPQITRNMQEVAGAGQDTRMFYDRQNQKVVWVVESRRQFGTEWERMDFISHLAPMDKANDEHKWEGNVWLRIDGDTPDTYREWRLPNAGISLTGTKPEGEIGLRLTYRISAGGFDLGQTSAYRYLMIRCLVETASLSVTLAQLQTAAASVSLADGDWLLAQMQWPDGTTVEHLFPISSYSGELTLPVSEVWLAIIEAVMLILLGATSRGSIDLTDDVLTMTTDGAGGNGCLASISLGRGTTTLWQASDAGSEARRAINVGPLGKTILIKSTN